MAQNRCRKDIVGKRFLCVPASANSSVHHNGHHNNKGSHRAAASPTSSNEPDRWSWRSGIIRAATHHNTDQHDLQLLLEYDDQSWERREWTSIHQSGVFHVFLVEHDLWWAEEKVTTGSSPPRLLPALAFSSVVNRSRVTFQVPKLVLGDGQETVPEHTTNSVVKSGNKSPVFVSAIEFLLDQQRGFVSPTLLQPFQDWESFGFVGSWSSNIEGSKDRSPPAASNSSRQEHGPVVKEAVRKWAELQAGQRILVTTPSVVVGYRCQVYRSEGATQWYTAVIVGHDEDSGELTLTDDTVLEEHYEDPRLLQIKLLGEGVVESILRGETVGITSRRSRAASQACIVQQQQQQQVHSSPSVVQAQHHPTAPLPNNKRLHKEIREASRNNDASTKSGKVIRSNPSKVNTTSSGSKERKGGPISRRTEDGPSPKAIEDKVASSGNESQSVAKTSVDVIPVSGEEGTVATSTGPAAAVITTSEGDNSRARHRDSSSSSISSSKDVTVPQVFQAGGGGGLVIIPLPPRSGGVPSGSSQQQPQHNQHDRPYSSVISAGSSTAAVHHSAAMDRERFEDEQHQRESNNRGQQQQKRSPTSSPSSRSTPNNGSNAKRPTEPTYPQTSGAASRDGVPPTMFLPYLPTGLPHSGAPGSLPFGLPPAGAGAASFTPQQMELIWKMQQMNHNFMSHPAAVMGLPASQVTHEELLLAHERQVARERERERDRRDIEAKEQQQQQREREREQRERMEKQQRDAAEREKQAHKQAVEQHFQESLLRYQQQMEQKGTPPSSWSLPPSSGGPVKGGLPPHPSQQTLLMPVSQHSGNQDQRDKDNRERFMAAYNMAIDRDRDSRERNSGPPIRQGVGQAPPPSHPPSTTSSGSNPYTALPRADLSFSIQGYQTAPSPSSSSNAPSQNQRKNEPQQSNSHHHLASNAPADYSSKAGSVIVGPGDSVMRDSPRIPDPRDQPQQRPPLSYKPYEPSPRLSGNNRTSRSPLQQQMIPPTSSTASSYPLHYAGPGPGPGGPSHPHSYSPSPVGSGASGNNSSRAGPPTNYMPPPSVSPSRSPAAPGSTHSSYPAMRYSPAPQTAPVPSTSPSAVKKTSPSPLQQQQQQQQSSSASYGRPLISGGNIGRSDQPIPLSLVTPSKSSYSPANEGPSSAPPPAHTARTSDPQRDLRDLRERDLRLYPHTAFAPLSHPLPPPQSLPSNNRPLAVPPGAPQLQLPQQQQPLDLGTYREDSPIPLISSARLPTGEAQSKKTRPEGSLPPQPPPIPTIPGYPSLGPVVGFPGTTPLMSVAALIDAGFNTSAAQVKPPSSGNAAAFAALGLSSTGTTNRLPSGTPPLMHSSVAAPSPVVVKNEPPASSDTRSPPISQPESVASLNRSTRTPPVTDVKIKIEPVAPSQSNVNNSSNVNTTTKSSAASAPNNNARPVHKLKTAWLQRHTGGDEMVIKPFSTSDVKIEQVERSSPGPLKTPAGRKGAANVKAEIANGYGSPLSVTDENETGGAPASSAGLRGGAGGKRKGRGPAASSVAAKEREKRAKTAASTVQAVSATPASSTGGSSSEADASESENDVGNGASSGISNVGRPKKGAASALVAKEGKGRGRQRNSDSSSSSKEGLPVRKGRGGGGANAAAVAAAASGVTPGSTSKPGPVNPLSKPPIPHLKRTGESFLQDAACFEVAPRLAKCRECRLTPNQRRRNEQQTNANIFCRFYAFRRLRYNKNGQLGLAGFSDPLKDASEEDLKLWLPQPEKAAQDLDVEMALFLLTHVGDQFCWMVQTEKEAKAEALVADAADGDSGSAVQKVSIAWKRVVQGVREMCDVCETTLFNFHWACGKCGYVVCIDCYKTRRTAKSPSNNGTGGNSKDDEKEEKDKDRDPYGWLFCNSRSCHDPDKLMPTQIIAGKALESLGRLVHTYRKQWNITQFCDCPEGKAIEASQTTTESNGGSVSSGSNGIVKGLSALGTKSDTGPSPDGIPNGSDGPDTEGSKQVNGNTAADPKGQTSGASSPLNVLADIALSKEKRIGKSKNGFGKGEGAVEGAVQNGSEDGDNEPTPSDEEEGGEHFSTLRELLIRPAPKSNSSSTKSSDQNSAPVAKRQKMETLEDVISCVIERAVDREASPDHSTPASGNNPPTSASASPSNPPTASVSAPNVKLANTGNGNNGSTKTNGDVEPTEIVMELKHFSKRRNDAFKTVLTREALPPRIMVLCESEKTYPDIPHSWLCSGKLLRLHEPSNPNNYKLFQDSWKRGQPVMVSGVTKAMDMSIWHPESFLKEFGDQKNDLVNCLTGNTVPNQPMKKFWEGFERLTKRLKDDKGQPMLLKLKDWPPVDDFAELLPTRFSDLMKALPLSEYTHRTGRLNLAGRLPDCFVRPDLGPKMYNAYGSALLCTKGTTNLHLDVSDAVNVMVYVGLPKEANSEEHIKEAIKAIEDSKVDILTRNRVEGGGEIPGALWHIYQARDADRIRDFLNKVALKRGVILEPHHDPIHDQSWYLDGELRTQLYEEYGVSGYGIVQCLGDAVFIPAGAPHQVRNLHSCIKVAEDFVSPETVAHCFQLTQEFRHLSDSHTNHEDKLQIKNIIYHAMKDSIAALAHAKGVTFANLLTIYENFAREEAASN